MTDSGRISAGEVISAGNRLIVPIIRKTYYRGGGVCIASSTPLALVIIEEGSAFIALLHDDIEPDTIMSMLSVILKFAD